MATNPFDDIVQGKSTAPTEAKTTEKSENPFAQFAAVDPISGGPQYKEFIQGATFGLGEEAMGRARSMLPGAPTAEQAIKAEREQLKQYEKEHPYKAAGLQIAGAFAPAAVEAISSRSTAPFAQPIAKGARLTSDIALSALEKYAPGLMERMPEFLKAGISGAEAGAKFGYGSSEDDAITDAIGGAVMGGKFGAALGTAFSAARPVVRNLFGDSEKDAMRRILNALNADGISLQELDRRLQAAGKPGQVTLADVGGENLQALMRVGTNVPGRTRQTATEFLNARQIDQYNRINEDVENLMLKGKGKDVYTLQKDLNTIRKEASDPLYKKANAVAINNTPELATLLKRIPTEALSTGKSIYKIEGEAIPDIPGNIEELAKQAKPLDFKALDLVKRGLDDLIDKHQQNGVYDTVGRSLINLKNDYLAYLDKANPLYKQARSAWGGVSESKRLLDEGKNFLKLNPSQVADDFSKMTQSEKEYFRLGAAEAIRDLIGGKQDMANMAQSLIGSERNRQKLRAIFPSEEAFNNFEQMMKAESQMSAARAYYLPKSGSKTAGMGVDVAEHGGSADLGLLNDIMSGRFNLAALKLAPSVYGAATGMKPATASALEKSLMTPGKTAESLAEKLQAAKLAEQRVKRAPLLFTKPIVAPAAISTPQEQYK